MDIAFVSQKLLDLIDGLIVDRVDIRTIFLRSAELNRTYMSGKKYRTSEKFIPVSQKNLATIRSS